MGRADWIKGLEGAWMKGKEGWGWMKEGIDLGNEGRLVGGGVNFTGGKVGWMKRNGRRSDEREGEGCG